MKTNDLTHVGVLGMKWGVRKGESPDSSIRKDRKSALKNRRTMSDEELNSRLNRLQKEKRFKELQDEDLKTGKQVASQFVGKYGGVILGSMAGAVGAKLVDTVIKNHSAIIDAAGKTLSTASKYIVDGYPRA